MTGTGRGKSSLRAHIQFPLDGLKITILAAANESLRKSLEPVPHQSDLRRFPGGDVIVLCRSRNRVEQPGELLHNRVGRRNDLIRLRSGRLRITDKVATGLLAKPFHDTHVMRKSNEIFNPIEGIPAPGACSIVGLRPFVYERERHSQGGGNLLRTGARTFERLFENFVGLHGESEFARRSLQ